jgi:hypothetical protein
VKVDVSRYPEYCKEQGSESNTRVVQALAIYAALPDKPDVRPRAEQEADILRRIAKMKECDLKIFLECANFLFNDQKAGESSANLDKAIAGGGRRGDM